MAQLWTSVLQVELIIAGEVVEREQQAPSMELPLNCDEIPEGVYVLYYRAVMPALAPGTHQVIVTIDALRPLPDGFGRTYGPGQIAVQTFRILAE